MAEYRTENPLEVKIPVISTHENISRVSKVETVLVLSIIVTRQLK